MKATANTVDDIPHSHIILHVEQLEIKYKLFTWSSTELSRPAWSSGDVVIGADDFLS